VAEVLGIGEGTVKTHLHHLFQKTGASRQAELVKLVAGCGASRLIPLLLQNLPGLHRSTDAARGRLLHAPSRRAIVENEGDMQ
jgi:hypothetical protein